MDALAQHWAQPLVAAGCVELQTRVTRIERDALEPRRWQLQTSGPQDSVHVFSGFDAVLLAMPSAQAAGLLGRSELGQHLAQQMDPVQVAPCWTLMLAFPQAIQPTLAHLGPQWNAALSTHHRIAWLARESSKPGRGGVERWTVQASAAWSQEHLEDDGPRVQAKLLKAFGEVTGIHAEPSYAQVHRWRWARTEAPLGRPHLWDGKAAHRRVRRLVPGPPGGRRFHLGPRTRAGGARRLEPVTRVRTPWPRATSAGSRLRLPGPCIAGSLVAALASWLDARAHGGRWLVRIEDVDTPRCVPGAAETILQQLAACGLVPDEPPVWQSQRGSLYQAALDQLVHEGRAYPCACSRKDIEQRAGSAGPRAPTPRRTGLPRHLPRRPAAAARRAPGASGSSAALVRWQDRRLGPQQQDVEREVGDFVLKRADGLWAYQLAVVVDDAEQGITQIVRGEDLADNTARQILLQRALRLPTPGYLHTPLVLGLNGEKLSKQNGAHALPTYEPLRVLNRAARVLGLPEQAGTVAQALAAWQAAMARLLQSAA